MYLDISELKRTLEADFKELGSYAAVGRKYGVHRAVIWRVMNDDYVPRDNLTRRKLGLKEVVKQEIVRDEKGRFAPRR